DESLEVIGEAIAENGKVLVTGCLGNKADLIKEKHPEVLSITGPQDYENLIEAVHTHAPIFANDFVSLVPPQGIKLTPRHYSYLKISEGCNNTCTFCIIPDIRGKLKSRSIDNIMKEAEKLKNAGVKELLVISQDTSAYGVDIKYKSGIWNNKEYQSNIIDLATALGDLDMWTRLHYVYPYPHVDKIVPLMAQGKILPYLDVSLQHSSPEVLKRMKRPAHTQKTLDRINKWRDICPDITISSTFIVGFPGETEADFKHLLDFAEKAQLDRVGCFKYSEVEGAKANQFDNLIFVATGILHTQDIKPEKSLKELSADKFIELFKANTIFPALVAKHFIPKLVKDTNLYSQLFLRVLVVSLIINLVVLIINFLLITFR
ncbi:30S ribosomal protein S12 methylthiotransferase RimO, partial [Francisella tularensis]